MLAMRPLRTTSRDWEYRASTGYTSNPILEEWQNCGASRLPLVTGFQLTVFAHRISSESHLLEGKPGEDPDPCNAQVTSKGSLRVG